MVNDTLFSFYEYLSKDNYFPLGFDALLIPNVL